MKYTHTEMLVIRKSLFLTQSQFAKLLDTSQKQVTRWETKFSPSPKWQAIIRQKLRDISYRLTVLKAISKTEKYFVLFESDMMDYAAKQILYATKILNDEECYLVKFNRESYEKFTGIDKVLPKPLNEWAKYYHKLKETKDKADTKYPLFAELDD